MATSILTLIQTFSWGSCVLAGEEHSGGYLGATYQVRVQGREGMEKKSVMSNLSCEAILPKASAGPMAICVARMAHQR